MKKIIKYATTETVEDFLANFDTYVKYIKEKDEAGLEKIFNKETILDGNIEFDYQPLITEGIYSDTDPKNVEILHRSLHMLSPVQASQEKFWLGMTMRYYKDYLYYRLNDELSKNKDERIKTALTSYKNGLKRALFVNVLSRLWWVGHLTYDAKREDPYELTKFFCESDFSARAVIFFSSNFTSNKELGLGILSAIYRLKQDGVDIKRDHFVQANKYLNLIGGVTLLDLKRRAEVEEEIYGYLKDNE